MKILICEDHKMYRDGVRDALGMLANVELFSEAADGKEAMLMLKQQPYDVVLMDINLPGKSGLQLLGEIKQLWPDTRVLMLSQYAEKNYALRSIKMGASGYLNKNSLPDELIKAIETVYGGEIYVSASVAAQMADVLSKNKLQSLHEALSEREFEVMLKLTDGKTLQEISDELNISYNSVCTYQSRLMLKLKLKNIPELVKYCIANDLIR